MKLEAFLSQDRSRWASTFRSVEVDGAVYRLASDGYMLAAEPATDALDPEPPPEHLAKVARMVSGGLSATLPVDAASLRTFCDANGDCDTCLGGLMAPCKTCRGSGRHGCYCDDCGLAHERDCANCAEGLAPCTACRKLELGVVHGIPLDVAKLRAGLRFVEGDELRIAYGTAAEPVALTDGRRVFVLMPMKASAKEVEKAQKWPRATAEAGAA